MIKTRFAPSPTGYLHVGGVRTALYSWLFTQKINSSFLLRIEDSDIKRSNKLYIKNIIETLKWLNINWDEGPFFQSNRINRYNEIINNMLINKTAYKCFCNLNRLKKLRMNQIQLGKKPKYDGFCKNNNINYDDNRIHVVRFCNPKYGKVIFNDLIRGKIEFHNNELDDLIIRRSNYYPTYNFCSVVDDYDMNITHVIRGEDHINNTPRQINIFKAIGANIPQYAHIPIILNDDGKKLSKRNGAINLLQYRDDGFLPEAILNHLLRLGWSYGNKEIFNINEMKKLFNISDVHKSSCYFNKKKLLWLNRYYINNLPTKKVSNYLEWHFNKKKINLKKGPNLISLIKLLGNRYYTLKDIVDNCDYFYIDKIKYNKKNFLKYFSKENIKQFIKIKYLFKKIKLWDIKSINLIINQISKKYFLSIKNISMSLRFAVTGNFKSPPLDKILFFIGKIRCINHINNFIIYMKKIYNIK